ncbi:MAG: hypothetical protein KGL16_08825 [Acidobacteriota bacterium]|nr:hypothetical protein [Acidobacteriota bacterium]
MLFDLRSRGRRQTVRVIYASLALIMVVGLVGLGIGTGNSGGILNAGQNGGGGGGNQVSNQALKRAINAVKKNPSPGNWANLMRARYSAAGSGSNYDTTNSTYTAGGRKQLQYGADAWQQYLKVATAKDRTGSGFLQTAFLAAGIYQSLAQWSNEAEAWNYALENTAGTAQALKPSLCLALSAYAAKQTNKGDLAAAEAVKLTPKTSRTSLRSSLKSVRSSPTSAQSYLASEGC